MAQTWHMTAIPTAWSPQALRCQLRAFDECAQLQPRRLGMARMETDECCEAAIRSRDDTLLADDIGEAFKALRDQFGMLDAVSLGIDYSDDQRLIVRELHVLPDVPFVFVPRVCRFDIDEFRSRLENQADDVFQRDVFMVGPTVISPTDMVADLCRGDVGKDVVENLDPRPKVRLSARSVPWVLQ
jgi:hypothetical protein